MDDVKGLVEELRDIARRGCGIHCSIEGEFSACDEAATALSTLTRERDEARAFIAKLVHMQSGAGWTRAVVRDAAAEFLRSQGVTVESGSDTTPEIVARALSAEAASSSKDERIRELEDEVERLSRDYSELRDTHDKAAVVRDQLRDALSALVLNIDAGGATLGAMADARATLAKETRDD